MKLKYVNIKSIFDKVDKLYETGLTKGLYCGYNNLYEHYSPKMGATTFVFGHPFSGKTEFILDLLIFLSDTKGFKHAIYTPETGKPEEIVLELISKAANEPVYQTMYNQKMGIESYYRHRDWVAEHFYIIDPDEQAVTLDQFYKTVELIESDNDCKINTTLTDPFNELKHEMDGVRQDIYLESQFGEVLKNDKKNNRHNFLVTHTAKQEYKVGQLEGGGEQRYYPVPTPHEVSGGLAWHRKAMNLLAVWRPPAGLIEDGVVYENNEVHIIIHKFKPKGTGKRGVVKLYYDAIKNRYYELENGNKRYAGKQPERTTYHQPASDVNF